MRGRGSDGAMSWLVYVYECAFRGMEIDLSLVCSRMPNLNEPRSIHTQGPGGAHGLRALPPRAAARQRAALPHHAGTATVTHPIDQPPQPPQHTYNSILNIKGAAPRPGRPPRAHLPPRHGAVAAGRPALAPVPPRPPRPTESEPLDGPQVIKASHRREQHRGRRRDID